MEHARLSSRSLREFDGAGARGERVLRGAHAIGAIACGWLQLGGAAAPAGNQTGCVDDGRDQPDGGGEREAPVRNGRGYVHDEHAKGAGAADGRWLMAYR